MAVKVIIPTPLRAYAGKKESVEVQAATVGEALSALTTQFGELKKHLFADDGRLRSFVNVYVNDEDIRYLQKDQTSLRDGDTVSIVPSIAGGSPAVEGREVLRRLISRAGLTVDPGALPIAPRKHRAKKKAGTSLRMTSRDLRVEWRVYGDENTGSHRAGW